MLTSGGEPLQLTNDSVDKIVTSFSTDGTQIYYTRNLGADEGWAIPTLGGTPTRIAAGHWMVPSVDGNSIFYLKGNNNGIYRVNKSALNEQKVYSLAAATKRQLGAILPYADGNHLLVLAADPITLLPNVYAYKVDISNGTEEDLGNFPAEIVEVVWDQMGKSVLFSRTLNGLTNLWSYDLKDKTFTQVSFGTGPDTYPIVDPAGKGIYFVNGKSAGVLKAWNAHSKQVVEIDAENASQPAISPDNKKVAYILAPARDHTEVWVANIDGSGKTKLASGESMATTTWSADSARLFFVDSAIGKPDKAYVINADGSGLHEIPLQPGVLFTIFLSPDEKTIYTTQFDLGTSVPTVWKMNADGSNPEKVVTDCGQMEDVSPDQQFLLGVIWSGQRTGIYQYSVADKKCTELVPGVTTFNAAFAPDYKSILYANPSQRETTVVRVPWSHGKLTGPPQTALTMPFAFPLSSGGNAYDFSHDLSTVVFALPSAHADLYLLSTQK